MFCFYTFKIRILDYTINFWCILILSPIIKLSLDSSCRDYCANMSAVVFDLMICGNVRTVLNILFWQKLVSTAYIRVSLAIIVFQITFI